MSDYQSRSYLSVVEVANHTGLPVPEIHRLVAAGALPAAKSASGQYRFDLKDIAAWQRNGKGNGAGCGEPASQRIAVNGATQQVIAGDARSMSEIAAASVHLVITLAALLQRQNVFRRAG